MKHKIKVTAYDNSEKLIEKTYLAKDSCEAIKSFEMDYGEKVNGCMIIAESKELVE